MESKLEAHDASLEEVKSRLGVLENASPSPSVKEVKSVVAAEVKIMEGVVLEAVENETKAATSYEEKIAKMVVDNEANSIHLINQLVAHAKSARGGNHSSENRTFSDTDMAGIDNIFYSEKTFRHKHTLYIIRPPT